MKKIFKIACWVKWAARMQRDPSQAYPRGMAYGFLEKRLKFSVNMCAALRCKDRFLLML